MTKHIKDMDLKQLRGEWARRFGHPTTSKDTEAMREKLLAHAERHDKIAAVAEEKKTTAKPTKNATPAALRKPPKTKKAPKDDPFAVNNLVSAANLAERDGRWADARTAWTQAAGLETNKQRRAAYRGKAAAAEVRASAAPSVTAILDGALPTPSTTTVTTVDDPMPADALPQPRNTAVAEAVARAIVMTDIPMEAAAAAVSAAADTAPETGPAGFQHDPRVLAKYKIGDKISYLHKKSGLTHEILIRTDGFEYRGPKAEHIGEVRKNLNRFAQIAQETTAPRNAFVVFGLADRKGGAPAAPRPIGGASAFAEYQAAYNDYAAAAARLPLMPGDLQLCLDSARTGAGIAPLEIAAAHAAHAAAVTRRLDKALQRLLAAARKLPAAPTVGTELEAPVHGHDGAAVTQ